MRDYYGGPVRSYNFLVAQDKAWPGWPVSGCGCSTILVFCFVTSSPVKVNKSSRRGQKRNINCLVMRLKFYAAGPVGGFVTHFGTDGVPGGVVTDPATTESHILMNGSVWATTTQHWATTFTTISITIAILHAPCTYYRENIPRQQNTQYNSSGFLERNRNAHNNHSELYLVIEGFWHFIGIFRNSDLNRFILRIMISLEELRAV